MSTISTNRSSEPINPTAGSGFATPTAEQKRVTDALYTRTPETPEPGELYSIAGVMRSTFDQNFVKLGDAGVLNLAQQAAERQSFSALLHRTGLPPAVGMLLHNRYTEARVTPDAEGVDPLADETAARQALRETWGERDAEDLLSRVQKWVKEQGPELNTILNTRAIGSRPDVILALAEHVREINHR